MREPGTIANGVLFGSGGYLYLAEGDHAVLDYVLGRKQVSESSKANFHKNIIFRESCLRARNIPYLHCISPDKHSVVTESFPFIAKCVLGDVYRNRDPEAARHILYPRELLQLLGEPAFLKTDTHTTDAATIVVASAIVERLTGKSQDEMCRKLRGELHMKRDWTGDLGGRFSPPLSEDRVMSELPQEILWFHNELSGGNNGITDIYFNPVALYKKRILVFGDSFGREYVRFLSRFFEESIFLRTAFFHEELLDSLTPDYVVTQNVERYLNSCRSDYERPSYFMYPHFSGTAYAPSSEFAEVFSAALSGGRISLQQTAARVASTPELIFRVDELTGGYLSGWARGGAKPVELEVFVNSHHLTSGVANWYRRDLDTAGIGHGRYGYAFQFPPPGLQLNDVVTIVERGTRRTLWSGKVDKPRHPGLDAAYDLASAWTEPPEPVWRVAFDGDDTSVTCNGFLIPTGGTESSDVRVFDKETGEVIPSASGPLTDAANYNWFLERDVCHLVCKVPRLKRRQLLTVAPESDFQFVAIPSAADFAEFRFAGDDRAARVAGGSNKLIGFACGGLTSALQLKGIVKRLKGLPAKPKILDWGCGAARVCQILAREEPNWQIYGADVDTVNIDWCKDNLSHLMPFELIGRLPPTSYPKGTFDVIYGISIITHLTEQIRNSWLAELARLTKRGGYCILTFGSPFYLLSGGLHHAVLPQYQEFQKRGIIDAQRDGNLGPEFADYYRTTVNTLANLESAVENWFEVLENHPLAVVYQDTTILRRR